MSNSRSGSSALSQTLVAVVHTPEVVRFVAVAADQYTLNQQLAEYVRQSTAHVLWTDDAVRVFRLLDEGKTLSAIEHYFATVGQRWDREWLTTTWLTNPLTGELA